MSGVAIKFDQVGKLYRLGQLGAGSITADVNRFLARLRGKEDPYSKIADVNDRSERGNSKYVWALKDISFEIGEGEVVGIIGRNGAGKSTMLKLLSRVTLPSTGEIRARGRIASLLEVGTGFHPELSGRENVFLNGAILGMSKQEIRNKFDEIVDFSGVERYIDTPVKRYSSGMYVRLAFAVAAHLEPEILIIDEVLAVGDAEFQKKCLGKMRDVSRNGRTVLFVSHNMPSIRALCNKAMLLQKGHLTGYGKTQEIISQYFANDYATEDNENGIIPEHVSLHNLGDGRFTFAKVMDEEKQYKKELFFQQRFSVHFKFEALKTLEAVNLSLFIVNTFGENVMMATDNELYAPTIMPSGVNEFIVEFEDQLMPGDYSIGLGLSYFHSGAMVDYVESICNFKVLKETQDRSMEYPWATVHGYTRPKTNWKKI